MYCAQSGTTPLLILLQLPNLNPLLNMNGLWLFTSDFSC
ncbi:hypothetical protein C4K38_3096 [Pseudomonas chlororaphis subsp. piscium]|nr:hypothetical protein C4K38_3096 [Pseudomonas chlororaphis subsp. piscium]